MHSSRQVTVKLDVQEIAVCATGVQVFIHQLCSAWNESDWRLVHELCSASRCVQNARLELRVHWTFEIHPLCEMGTWCSFSAVVVAKCRAFTTCTSTAAIRQ